MAKVTPSTVMVEIGAEKSLFFPIKSEPENAKPVYDTRLDMGHFVKAEMTLNFVSASIPGDNVSQCDVDEFVSGQLNAETTMNSLEINSKIYGHKYTEEDGEVSAVGDVPVSGGYAFVQHILKKDRTKVYRATFLRKVTAIPGSEKQTGNTKTPGSLAFANNAVAYKISPDNTGTWRNREDFPTMEAAMAYIDKIAATAT